MNKNANITNMPKEKMSKSQDYLRVTEILYPFSGLSKIDPTILKNAAERGTKIHEHCEAIIDHMGTIDINPDWSGYIKSFEMWAEDKKFLKKPSRLYCDKYMITGEIDGLYKTKDGIVLFDIKTPAKEGKTWYLQGSAYSYLCKKAGINVDKIEFVKLSKNGSEAKVFTYEEKFDDFIQCLEIYKKFFAEEKKENNIDYI